MEDDSSKNLVESSNINNLLLQKNESDEEHSSIDEYVLNNDSEHSSETLSVCNYDDTPSETSLSEEECNYCEEVNEDEFYNDYFSSDDDMEQQQEIEVSNSKFTFLINVYIHYLF